MSYLEDSKCCGATVKIDPDGIAKCTWCSKNAYRDEEEDEDE